MSHNFLHITVVTLKSFLIFPPIHSASAAMFLFSPSPIEWRHLERSEVISGLRIDL